jgi:hypothetical protein
VQFIASRVCDGVASCVRYFGQRQTEGLKGISVAWRCHPGRSRVVRETIGHIIMLRDGVLHDVAKRAIMLCRV